MLLRTLDRLVKLARSPRTASRTDRFRPRLFRPEVESLEGRWLPSNYAVSFGGSLADTVSDIAVDAAGNAYVVGHTVSPDFPTPSGYDSSFNGDTDAFIAKLDATGNLVWATYLGSTGNDRATGVAVDAAGNVFVTGFFIVSGAGDLFPTTPGAFRTAPSGSNTQTWAARFNGGTGNLDYSTFLGAGARSAIAVDASGNAYVALAAYSADFPTTPGAFQPTGGGGDVVVAKLNPTGTGLVYCTFLGGSGGDYVNDIAVDAAGNACVMGDTSSLNFPTTATAFRTTAPNSYGGNFVAKLNGTGSALLYSTYLEVGGSRPEYGGMAMDGDGNIYVTSDAAPSVPTTSGAFESLHSDRAIVVTKLNPALSGAASLAYSTFIGHGLVRDIAVNNSGEACITGDIAFPVGDLDFPITPGAPFTAGTGFLTRLNSTGSAVLFSTRLDREPIGVALDTVGNAYLASALFQSGASYDAAVDKLPASDVDPPAEASLTCTDVRALENVPNFYFNVHRWGPTDQVVTVNFATQNGTATAKNDFIFASGTLTFATGEVTKTITVKIKNDGKKEPTESFYVILSGATNATIQRNGTGAIENDGDGKGGGTGALNAVGVPGKTRRSDQNVLRSEQVHPLLGAAIDQWTAAGADKARLSGIDVRIANLGGRMLGFASGHTIWLDDNAAGRGWFVDSTPWDDSEFTTPGNQGEQNRMDLLTVLEHEMGHLLGHDHEATGVMIDTLSAGTRRGAEHSASFSDLASVDWLSALVDLQSPARRKR